MKKFLTVLFAFTCLAFSEMRGQVTLIIGNADVDAFGSNIMQTSDGVNYMKGFNVINGFELYGPSTFIIKHNGVSYSPQVFPSGTANLGVNSISRVYRGYYSLIFNISTKEYSFVGGSYLAFNDCGIFRTSCGKVEVVSSDQYSSYQWKRNGVPISGATGTKYIHPSNLTDSSYNYTCEVFSADSGALITSNTLVFTTAITINAQIQSFNYNCSNRQLTGSLLFSSPIGFNGESFGWNLSWKKNGQNIPESNSITFDANPEQDNVIYTLAAICSDNNFTKESSGILAPGCYSDVSSATNYLLIQNVTTSGNNSTSKTIQVQFDIAWGNTWRDDINWDAAWVFMKYKTASGEWKHAKINPTGYDQGQGSPNIIQPTSDKLGAFIRLGLKGQGNFNSEGMQLQWNYGLDGLNSVSGLEVKVFAIETVYIPQGGFYASDFAMTGGNLVVNERLSPKFSGNYRIKGDAGIDADGNGQIDNAIYPTGYYDFYAYKKSMSRQQFSDFLNCLSAGQRSPYASLISYGGYFLSSGQYFHADPYGDFSANDSDNLKFALAYADWSGMRPLSLLEKNKMFNGAYNYSGTNYFGVNGQQYPVNVNFFAPAFSNQSGDGTIGSNGLNDVSSWTGLPINNGSIRLCRSAE